MEYSVQLLSHVWLFLTHVPRHARPPCPSPTPRVHPNTCPSSWWCHPAISSSVVPFSSCLQSFPASGSFPMSQLFSSGGQSKKQSKIMSFVATWMEQEIVILSEISETEKDKYMILIICGIWKRATNELTYETEIDLRRRKQTYGYRVVYRRGEINWKCIDKYNLEIYTFPNKYNLEIYAICV